MTLALAFPVLACGTAPVPTATPGPPVGSAVPSATRSGPSGPLEQRTPSPEPNATPTVEPPPSPSPTPAGLHVNGLARVTVNELRRLADPERPRDHAFESPAAAFANYLSPLRRDQEVFLIDGPRELDGRQYWKVADDPFGCCAPFGWIGATSASGDPTIEPVEVECPDLSQTFVAFRFPGVNRLGVVSCFGSTEVRVRGVLTCEQPTADASYWLGGVPWIEPLPEPRSCYLDNFEEQISVYGHPVTSLLDNPNYAVYYTDFVELTGHFNDSASSDCVWTQGDFMQFDVSDAPKETAVFSCRNRFVVTAVEKP